MVVQDTLGRGRRSRALGSSSIAPRLVRWTFLTAFNAGDQFLGNAEIVRTDRHSEIDSVKDNCHPLRNGYLKYSSAIGQYEIGPRVLALEFLADVQAGSCILMPGSRMNDLAREANAVVGLSILDDLSWVFIDTAVGDHAHFRRAQVGYRIPIALTTMGWACLSAMNRPKGSTLLERIRQAYPDDHKIWKTLKGDSGDLERGFCISMGLFDPGSNASGSAYLHPMGDIFLRSTYRS